MTTRSPYTCTVPEAAKFLGIGRDATYRAIRAGQIPSLRIGRRIVVPVAPLLGMLGVPTPDMSEPAAPTAGLATLNNLQEHPHAPHQSSTPVSHVGAHPREHNR